MVNVHINHWLLTRHMVGLPGLFNGINIACHIPSNDGLPLILWLYLNITRNDKYFLRFCYTFIQFKWECHFDEIFITGCTRSWHFDIFQWWKFCQSDDMNEMEMRWNTDEIFITGCTGSWQLPAQPVMEIRLPSSLKYKMHQIPTLKRFSYCLAAVFAESLEATCQVENEDVDGAAPTGDAPSTSEWSTILLPT